MTKIIMEMLVDQVNQQLITSVTDGYAKVISVREAPAEVESKYSDKKIRPYLLTGKTLHENAMEWWKKQPNSIRASELQRHLETLHYSSSAAANVFRDFIETGLAIKLERGVYRLTAKGVQVAMTDIPNMDFPSSVFHKRKFYGGLKSVA